MTDHNKGCPDCAAMGRNFQSFATSVALEILVQSAFQGGQIYHDIPDEIECDPRDNTAPVARFARCRRAHAGAHVET